MRPSTAYTAPEEFALDGKRLGSGNMPLVFTIAFRNLFYDRLRFIATVIGIVFSIVLVTVQMGLYLGFGRTVTTMIDHVSACLLYTSPSPRDRTRSRMPS